MQAEKSNAIPPTLIQPLSILVGFGPVATPVQSQEDLQRLFEAKCWDYTEDAEAVWTSKNFWYNDGSSSSVGGRSRAVGDRQTCHRTRSDAPENEAALTEEEEVFKPGFVNIGLSERASSHRNHH